MSKTLKLADELLLLGRRFQEQGRDQDALHILGRLAKLPELPPIVAEEASIRRGELEFRAGNYRKARRHLTAGLRARPDSARLHCLLAGAIVEDEEADLERAARHYRKSLRLDPEQPDCLVEYGNLLLHLGETIRGVKALRRAARLAADNASVIGSVVQSLEEAGRRKEVVRVLLAARFRNPHNTDFLKLWNDFQGRRLIRKQESAKIGYYIDLPDNDPALLPFVRPDASVRLRSKNTRKDSAEPLQGLHNRVKKSLRDRRNVQ